MDTSNAAATRPDIEIVLNADWGGSHITWRRDIPIEQVQAAAYEFGFYADTCRRTEQYWGTCDRAALIPIAGPWPE